MLKYLVLQNIQRTFKNALFVAMLVINLTKVSHYSFKKTNLKIAPKHNAKFQNPMITPSGRKVNQVNVTVHASRSDQF